MHGLLGTYTDYVNLRFSHIHDYLGSTIIRDSRVCYQGERRLFSFSGKCTLGFILIIRLSCHLKSKQLERSIKCTFLMLVVICAF